MYLTRTSTEENILRKQCQPNTIPHTLRNYLNTLLLKAMGDTDVTKAAAPTADEVQKLLTELMDSVNRERGADFSSEYDLSKMF